MQSNNQLHEHEENIATLSLLGGILCLDFANTVDPRVGDRPHEYLGNYRDLVEWSQHVGILNEQKGLHLLQKASEQSTEAKRTFERAITLRETIYSVFSSIAQKTSPSAAELGVLQGAYGEGLAYAELMPTANGGFVWQWVNHDNALNGIFWPIIHSAIDLLTAEEVKRVKECPGVGDCGWLFLDTSKNGSRQWCSMEGCGSRAKMRRQYARKRVERTGHTRSAN